MSKRVRRFMKKERKSSLGFTIIELITAIAILAVLGVSVGMFMSTSSKTYSKLSVEAQLQSEAQLVANMINELAIDSFDAASTTTESFGYESGDGKILILDSTVEGVKKQYIVGRKAADKELYLAERTDNGSGWGAVTEALLGNYIADFTVDTSRVESENMLRFTLSYEKGGRTYDGNYQVLMRNRAYADREEDPSTPNQNVTLALQLDPQFIYVDIVNETVPFYYIGTTDDSNKRTYTDNGIPFTATVFTNQNTSDKKVTWELKNEDEALYTMSEEDAETSNLLCKNDTKKFKDSMNDSFTLVINKTIPTTAGGTLKASPKTAQILLRRIKSINLYALSGATQWNSRYSELYGGVSSPEAQGYVYAGDDGKYQKLGLNASIVASNIAYGGGLDWELYIKNDTTGDWEACTNTAFAKLDTNETLTGSSNSVTMGSSAANGQLYKVKVISKFDNSYFAEYIFGVAPVGNTDDSGFYSRGYYTNMSNFWKGQNIKNTTISEVVYMAITEITGDNAVNERDKIDRYVKLIYQNGQYYVYIDYDAFLYNDSQKEKFYTGQFIIHFCIGYAVHEGNKTIYYMNGAVTDTDKKEMAARLGISVDDIHTGSWEGNTGYANDTNATKYILQPVTVSKISPASDVFVLRKGESKNIYVKTAYYNLLLPRNGMYYFGTYIDDFKNNLVQPGKADINPYFNIQLTSQYGDTNRFVDTASLQLTAKTLTAQKKYLTAPATLRLAANDFYLIGQAAASYTDYKVLIANVEGTDVYIQGPAQDAGNTMAWTSAQRTDIEAGKHTEITGLNSSGAIVTATVYKESNKYYCKYGGKTYRYNTTYKFWQK